MGKSYSDFIRDNSVNILGCLSTSDVCSFSTNLPRKPSWSCSYSAKWCHSKYFSRLPFCSRTTNSLPTSTGSYCFLLTKNNYVTKVPFIIPIVWCKFHRPIQYFEHYFGMLFPLYYHLAEFDICVVRNGTKFLPVHHLSTSKFPSFSHVILDYTQIFETVFNRKKQGSMRDFHHIPTVQGLKMLYHQLRP